MHTDFNGFTAPPITLQHPTTHCLEEIILTMHPFSPSLNETISNDIDEAIDT